MRGALLVFILVIYVTMVYGPIAAFLVESFPARIRYTSMSLPYHVGNGWFGGFLPLIARVMVAIALINPGTFPSILGMPAYFTRLSSRLSPS